MIFPDRRFFIGVMGFTRCLTSLLAEGVISAILFWPGAADASGTLAQAVSGSVAARHVPRRLGCRATTRQQRMKVFGEDAKHCFQLASS